MRGEGGEGGEEVGRRGIWKGRRAKRGMEVREDGG